MSDDDQRDDDPEVGGDELDEPTLVERLQWAVSDAAAWIVAGRRRYIVKAAGWLGLVWLVSSTLGLRNLLAASWFSVGWAWWGAWHPTKAALACIVAVVAWRALTLYYDELEERSPIPIRVLLWLVRWAAVGARFVAMIAWGFRGGLAVGYGRMIWRASRVKADADTKVDKKTHGGRRLPGVVKSARFLTLPRRPDGRRQPRIGIELLIRLPGGWRVSDLDGVRIASGTWRTINARVSHIQGKGPEHMRVALLFRDPLLSVFDAGPPVPLETAIGVDEYGRQLVIDMRTSNVALGGMPRSGKSTALQIIIGAFAADKRATIYLLDGKHVEFTAWRKRATRMVGAEPAKGLEAVRAVQAEIDSRYAQMDETGYRNWLDMPAKLAPDAALLVVDEIPIFTDDPKVGAAILETLLDICRRGLACNVHLAVATQKATGESLSPTLRDLCGTRVAFSCSSLPMGVGILGQALGHLAVELPGGDAYRGRLVAVHEDGTYQHGRAFRVTDRWLKRHARAVAPPSSAAVTAPAPAPRSGAGAPTPAPAGDATAARTPEPASADADARPCEEGRPSETRRERRARNAAKHERERAEYLANVRASKTTQDTTPTSRTLSVVGGVERREEA